VLPQLQFWVQPGQAWHVAQAVHAGQQVAGPKVGAFVGVKAGFGLLQTGLFFVATKFSVAVARRADPETSTIGNPSSAVQPNTIGLTSPVVTATSDSHRARIETSVGFEEHVSVTVSCSWNVPEMSGVNCASAPSLFEILALLSLLSQGFPIKFHSYFWSGAHVFGAGGVAFTAAITGVEHVMDTKDQQILPISFSATLETSG